MMYSYGGDEFQGLPERERAEEELWWKNSTEKITLIKPMDS